MNAKPLPLPWMVGVIGAGILTLSASGQGTDSLPYVAPNFGQPLLPGDADSLKPVARDELCDILMDVVDHPDVDGVTRGKAMALAFALGHQKEVIAADFKLRHGFSPGEPEPAFSVASGRKNSKTGLGKSLAVHLENSFNSASAPYLGDIFTTLTGLKPGTETPDWSRVLPDEAIAATAAAAETSTASSVVTATVNPSNAIQFDQAPSMSGDDAGGFKKRQSLIKGLLVQQLEGSNFAGGASQMNATVTAGNPGQATTFGFNQGVGESMESGLKKVMSFISSRHGEIPEGQSVEISFESQYNPKDGDSASTACALLLESLITGAEIDPGFAVTGALSEEGEVEAVGGIDGKIRGATSRHCTHVAIPSENEEVLADMLITYGIQPLAAIQVFTIDTFASAQALAAPASQRAEDLRQAVELFETVQKVLLRPNGAGMLRNTHVQQRLHEVVELAPNHASAKYLLLEALNRTPKQLTLRGSLTAIDRAALPLIQGLRNKDYRGAGSALDSDEFANAAYNLKRIRPQLDQRAWKTADAIVEFSEAFRVLRNNPPSSPRAINELINRIDTAGSQVERNYDNLIKLVRLELGLEE